MTLSISYYLHVAGIPFMRLKYSMFCSTERFSNIGLYWGQYPISFLTFWNYVANSIPDTVIEPEVGSSYATRVLNVVDLPAPFTPRSAKHSPLLIPKESRSTAHRGLPGQQTPAPFRYIFRRFSTLICNSSSYAPKDGVAILFSSDTISSLKLSSSSFSGSGKGEHFLWHFRKHFATPFPSPFSIAIKSENQKTKWIIIHTTLPSKFSITQGCVSRFSAFP